MVAVVIVIAERNIARRTEFVCRIYTAVYFRPRSSACLKLMFFASLRYFYSPLSTSAEAKGSSGGAVSAHDLQLAGVDMILKSCPSAFYRATAAELY